MVYCPSILRTLHLKVLFIYDLPDHILLLLPEDDERAKLAECIGEETLTRDRCLELLRRLTSNIHRLRVITLDTYFAQLAEHWEIGSLEIS